MKRNGNAERQKRENRGAEGEGGVGSVEGGMPPLHIFFHFLAGNNAFWRILGDCL